MRYPISILMILCSLLSIAQVNQIAGNTKELKVNQENKTISELLKLANKYTVNDPEKAKVYAKRVIAISRIKGDEKGEISGLYKLGAIHINQGSRNDAKPLFESGLEKSREIKDQGLLAFGYYNLSRFYEGSKDFKKALTLLEQSFSLYSELGDEAHISHCYISFGRIHQELGNYELALINSFKSLRIGEKLGHQTSIAVVKTNIGHTYMLNAKYNEAIQYFKEALIIDQTNNDQEGILINTLNIGACQQKMKLFDQALISFKKSLRIAQQLKYLEDEAIILGNIGSTLKEQGFPKAGLEYLFSALTLENKNGYNNAHTLNGISETYITLQNSNKATEYGLMAVKSSKLNNDIDQLRYAYLNLSKSYEKNKNYKNAFEALELSNFIKDSLFSIDKEQQMSKLKISYQTEKQEQEISTLNQQRKTAEFKRKNYLIAGILISTILFLLFNQQRQKSKKNHLLFLKEQELTLMKSNFFSNISHEFRTPLTLILGPIQFLKAGVKNSKMNFHLDVMERNANRLLSLINQLLDLAKIESGKYKLTLEKSDIFPVIKGVVMSFKSKADAKHIHLEVISRLDQLPMRFDRDKVETILINLITNAFNFTADHGFIKVFIEKITDHNNKWCKITVQDNGQGIPSKDIKTIFNRFYQSTNHSDGQYDGSGIGLALTKELVELHKGSIKAVSNEGAGTEIIILLPLNENTFKKSKLTSAKKNEKPITKALIVDDTKEEVIVPSSNSKKASKPILLLIEDNEDVMYYLIEILGNTYEILGANNGDIGIKMALENIPDLIISDVMMPIKNGYEVCKTLKQNEKTSHVPIILLTAKASLEDKMEGLETKADIYLTKPFAPKELLIQVKNLIESRKKLKNKYKERGFLKPIEVAENSIDEKFLNRIIELVELHISNDKFGVVKLSEEIGMSRSLLHRKMIGLLGHGPNEFIRSYRLLRANDLLKQGAVTASQAAYKVGFGSPSYFTKCYHKHFGYTPSETEKQKFKT